MERAPDYRVYVPLECLTTPVQLYRDLQARYRNMYIPPDFCKLVSCWQAVRPNIIP